MEISRHHIIEFEDSGKRRLAWVVDEAKSGKITVRLADGTERKVQKSRVRLQLPHGVDSWKEIESLERTAQSIVEDIDLESLWELARELGDTVTLEDLAEFQFDGATNARILALHRALRQDSLYFKARKDAYEPRSPENVEQILAQEERLRRKKEEIDTLASMLTDAMRAPDEERAEKFNEIKGLDWTRRYVDYMRRLAIHGEEEAREEALDIVSRVDMPEGKRFRSVERRAFEILVALGELDEHANLRVLRSGLKAAFPDEVEERAASLTPSLEGRRDLRDLLVFTIDDPWTRDLDDALSIQREGSGWVVGVHIADPASVLEPGDPIDLVARDRGATIYLPEGSIPMLPRSLSEGRLSLEPGQDRPALSFLVRVDDSGVIVEYEIVPSVIRSDARLDYDTVAADLRSQVLDDPIHEALISLDALARRLARKRDANGAISIFLPEVKVKIAPDGSLSVHTIDTSSPARLLVAEYMILCNHVAGRFAQANSLPVIYRTQRRPEDMPRNADPSTILGAFDMLSRMKKGEFSTKPAPHHGLGVDVYLQASSPLRRYADLLAHYQLKAFLDGREIPFTQEQILPILGTADSVAWEAAILEREANRYWLLVYFQENAGNIVLRGTILDVKDPRHKKATVFLNDYGLRVNVTFDHPVERGDEYDLVVSRVDPRGDVLMLREAL